jgi:hypothetical protein
LRPYKKRFIVKLRDSVDIPAGVRLVDSLEKEEWLPWKQLLDADPAIEVRHVFSSLTKKELGHLVSSAKERDPSYTMVSLFNYLSIIPSRSDRFDTCFKIVDEWRGDIENVYVDLPPVAPPSGNPKLNTYFRNQIHHQPAPLGIDAMAAWAYPGGDGSKASFIDVEQGWLMSYPDLQSANIQLIHGVSRDYKQHGCYVLGVVVATNNTSGIVGIAWGTQSPRIVSEWSDEDHYSTANAIAYAASKLNEGDVMLVQAQLDGDVPIELKQEVRDAIAAAIGKGITVVIPAGNGGGEYDSTNIEDSGAIMVAAGRQPPKTGAALPVKGPRYLGRKSNNNTNFGARIDCHAHGEDVVTAAATTGLAFFPDFGGSSSAAAIVAGSAVLIQSIARQLGNGPLPPSELRELLRDTEFNTPSQDPESDKIGHMPNLAKILEKRFGPPPA